MRYTQSGHARPSGRWSQVSASDRASPLMMFAGLIAIELICMSAAIGGEHKGVEDTSYRTAEKPYRVRQIITPCGIENENDRWRRWPKVVEFAQKTNASSSEYGDIIKNYKQFESGDFSSKPF